MSEITNVVQWVLCGTCGQMYPVDAHHACTTNPVAFVNCPQCGYIYQVGHPHVCPLAGGKVATSDNILQLLLIELQRIRQLLEQSK